MTIEQLCEQLRTAIEGDDRTPNAIALVAGVSPGKLYRLVNGHNVSLENAGRIARVLGLRVDLQLTTEAR